MTNVIKKILGIDKPQVPVMLQPVQPVMPVAEAPAPAPAPTPPPAPAAPPSPPQFMPGQTPAARARASSATQTILGAAAAAGQQAKKGLIGQ